MKRLLMFKKRKEKKANSANRERCLLLSIKSSIFSSLLIKSDHKKMSAEIAIYTVYKISNSF
jgi:hypothetical protein